MPRPTIRTLANDPGGAAAAPLWLACFGRLADRVAHELKNPLNGLALNLEVVRSRSARAGSEGSAVAPFAAAAASELERSVVLVEALLSLARPASIPVDLQTAVRPLAALYGAIAGAVGGSMQISVGAEQMFVEADGTTARTLVAEVLDATVASGRVIHGTLDRNGGSVSLKVTGGAMRPIAPEIERLAAGCGIRLSADDDEILLLFPALARAGVDSNT